MGNCNSAVILCGGGSSRMGFDKCTISIDGKLLIELIADKLHTVFNEVILISNDENKFRDLGFSVFKDIKLGCGPAGGICTPLKTVSSQYVFVTGCDMPCINTEYIKYMISIIDMYSPDCVISRRGNFIEPLYAFYSKKLIGSFEQSIMKQNYKLFEIISSSDIFYIEEEKVRSYSPTLDIFTNLNYFEDLDLLQKIYGRKVEIDGCN